MYYGDYNLYEIDPEYFSNKAVNSIGGKYDNTLALSF